MSIFTLRPQYIGACPRWLSNGSHSLCLAVFFGAEIKRAFASCFPSNLTGNRSGKRIISNLSFPTSRHVLLLSSYSLHSKNKRKTWTLPINCSHIRSLLWCPPERRESARLPPSKLTPVFIKHPDATLARPQILPSENRRRITWISETGKVGRKSIDNKGTDLIWARARI